MYPDILSDIKSDIFSGFLPGALFHMLFGVLGWGPSWRAPHRVAVKSSYLQTITTCELCRRMQSKSALLLEERRDRGKKDVRRLCEGAFSLVLRQVVDANSSYTSSCLMPNGLILCHN